MKGFWLTFEDGTQGYCEGNGPYDAVRIAEHVTKKKVKVPNGNQWNPDVPALPYPATPIVWQFDHPVSGKFPAFCYTPKQCAGHTSCPKSHACSE